MQNGRTVYFMLGFEDIWITLAYSLTVLSAIGGVIYGAITWNDKGGDEE
jgi:hypothetical protein